MMRRKGNQFFFFFSPQGEEGFFFESLCTRDWLRDHTSWVPCVIEMKIKGILKSCFWNSLHQGTLSILYSRIHSYMLSYMIKVDPWLLLPLCVLYEIQNQIFQQMVSEWSSISCLYNMWLSFRIKEKTFSWCSSFLQ